MIKLNQKSKAHIEKVTGLSSRDISKMGTVEIDTYFAKKTGKSIIVSMPKSSLLSDTGRGSVYLMLNRIAQISKINKKLSKI